MNSPRWANSSPSWKSCTPIEKSPDGSSPKKAVSKANIIAEIINWIDANHREHITLERLAQQSGLTPNYICRIFKEYTAKTPIEYVNAVRIENVCRDIALGGKNITEAAMDNGFNDISYFCKVFKKQKGVSAKEYLEKTNIAG